MKKNQPKNYLENKPLIKESVKWSANEESLVTLEIENRGFFNRIAQKIFGKPPVSFVHLDANGSFVWQLIDGKTSVLEMGNKVKEKFGDAAEPLYPRLAKFFQIIESYGFVTFAD